MHWYVWYSYLVLALGFEKSWLRLCLAASTRLLQHTWHNLKATIGGLGTFKMQIFRVADYPKQGVDG